MGKWDKLKGALPAYVDSADGADDRRAVIDRRKAELLATCVGNTPSADEVEAELTVLFEAARDERDRLDEETRRVNADLEAIEELILEEFDRRRHSSVRRTDGTLFFEEVDPYVSVVDPAAALAWAAVSAPELLALQPSRTKAFIKENYLLDMRPLPEFAEAYLKRRVRMRRR